MADRLKQHRVIGIRHALKQFKSAGLVDPDSMHPNLAVSDVQMEAAGTAQEWYRIGAKRGAREIIEAILAGKFDVRTDSHGNREIVARAKKVSWTRKLNVAVGNSKRVVPKRKYELTLRDLGWP